MQPENRDLREKLEPFRRRWLLMAFIVVAITAATYDHYAGQPVKYDATASVFARSAGFAPLVGDDPESDPARRLLNEAQLLQTPAVATNVAGQLHYKGNPGDLLQLITITPSADSDILSITASTSHPNASAKLANAFADAFAALSLPPTTPPTAPGVEVINRATAPTGDSGPSPARNALFAAVLGLVLAVLLVKAMAAFDRRLRHRGVEAAYALPLLASIPFSRKAHSATRSGARLPVEMMERVRGLRTMLDHGAGSGAAPRTVLVTSAIPGEGKSTLVKSLALAYFESAKSVLVIDGDLRRPMLHEFFDAPLVPGLSDVLRSTLSLADAVQEVRPGDLEPAFGRVPATSESTAEMVPRGARRQARTTYAPRSVIGRVASGPVLHLLASGSRTSDPAALLGNAQLKPLLAEAAAAYDIVLIDSAPVLSVSDAIPVATAVNAVVVVARSEFTTRDAAERCRQALERVAMVKLVGVVANGVRIDDEVARPYYVTAAS
jgi:Mrp family chromosome partitioning ATPase/capsular polysaccharide biosynthesis protein